MQLMSIDKVQYRQRLNRISICSIAALIVISLSSSSLLIALLSDGQGSHFWLNFFGVVIGCIVVGISLKRLKNHAFFKEVAYIWDLKHELNLIQRKLRAIEAAAAKHDPDALLILLFSYQASRLVWQLDDNTLMMSELSLAQNTLQQQITTTGLDVNVANYRRELLSRF